jgi:serine phosphatase RsbU (regulator of sigma subunit)
MTNVTTGTAHRGMVGIDAGISHASSMPLQSPMQALPAPLEVTERTDYHRVAVRVELGDLALIHTDALLETRGVDGRLLGNDGLSELVCELDSADRGGLCVSLLERVTAFRSHRLPEDQVGLVLLHYNGGPPAHVSVGGMVMLMSKMLGLIRV